MNWKDNYIIKSLRSRPVLFGLIFMLGCFVTYEITSTYTSREYEKRVEKQSETESDSVSFERECLSVRLKLRLESEYGCGG